MPRLQNQSTLQPLPDSLCKHWASVWSCDQSLETLSLQLQPLDSKEPETCRKLLKAEKKLQQKVLSGVRTGHIRVDVHPDWLFSAEFCDVIEDFSKLKR